MMPMTKQRLDIPLKLKSVSDSGEFEGYGSVFGVKDSYDDVVVPGAFSKSLQSWREKNALQLCSGSIRWMNLSGFIPK
jgi:phage head maturation protease